MDSDTPMMSLRLENYHLGKTKGLLKAVDKNIFEEAIYKEIQTVSGCYSNEATFSVSNPKQIPYPSVKKDEC
ncbi:UNVERIFIED_CONTAM: hypothetical protein NCL1_29846 [Trichonephila clavipes]